MHEGIDGWRTAKYAKHAKRDSATKAFAGFAVPAKHLAQQRQYCAQFLAGEPLELAGQTQLQRLAQLVETHQAPVSRELNPLSAAGLRGLNWRASRCASVRKALASSNQAR